MSLIINKDIVVKNVTVEALICDRPCWLYWIKCTEWGRVFPELVSLYDSFLVTDLERPFAAFNLTVEDVLVFKNPLRFNKALYFIPEGVVFRGTLAFVPDY